MAKPAVSLIEDISACPRLMTSCCSTIVTRLEVVRVREIVLELADDWTVNPVMVILKVERSVCVGGEGGRGNKRMRKERKGRVRR